MKSPLIACLITAGLLSGGERFEVRCEPDLELSRSFRHSQELTLAEMITLIDGQEMPGGKMEQEQGRELRLEFRDRVLSVDGPRAETFERTYEQITGSRTFLLTDPLGEEHGGETEESSPLEGVTVRFELEDGEFGAQFPAGQGGEEEWLEGLEALLDLEELLPAEEVEPGDTWTVDPALLGLLQGPGGDLRLEADWQGEAAMLGPGGPGEDAGQGELDGECTAEYRGVVERDGKRLAEVHLELEVTSLLDLSETFANMEDEMPDDLPPGMVMPQIESMEHETETLGEGSFLWDLEAGRLHSLELQCELTQTQTMIMLISMGPEEQEMEQITILEGTETYEVSVTE